MIGHIFYLTDHAYNPIATGILVHTCIYIYLLFEKCKVRLTIVKLHSVKAWCEELMHEPANVL